MKKTTIIHFTTDPVSSKNLAKGLLICKLQWDFPRDAEKLNFFNKRGKISKTIQISKEWKVEFSCKTGFLPYSLRNDYANALKVDGFPTLFASQKLVSYPTLYKMNVQMC